MAVSYASNRVTIGSYKSGTTGTSGTNTLVSSGTEFVAGDVGRYIAIKPDTADSGSFQVRRITGYNSTSSVTVDSDWVGGAPSPGVSWVMSHNCQDVHDIGDAALEKIGDQSFRWNADWSISADGFFADADISLEMTTTASPGWPMGARSIVQFGTLIGGEANNSTETINGCRISFQTASTSNQDIFSGSTDRQSTGHILNFYASLVESKKVSTAFMFSRLTGPARFIGSIFDGQLGGRFYHEDSEWVGCSHSGNTYSTSAWSIGATFNRSITDVKYGSNTCAVKTYYTFVGTFRDCIFRDTNTDFVRLESHSRRLIFTSLIPLDRLGQSIIQLLITPKRQSRVLMSQSTIKMGCYKAVSQHQTLTALSRR
jgi:hypothetical protein